MNPIICPFLLILGAGCALCALGGSSLVAGADLSPSFASFDLRASADQPLSVVFSRRSLTWGASASNPSRTSCRALMGQYHQERYPKSSFTFIDAAIGGTGSKPGKCDARDAATVQPLTVPFTGTFVRLFGGLFGEADQEGLSFKASVDGRPRLYRESSKAAAAEIWPWNMKNLGTL